MKKFLLGLLLAVVAALAAAAAYLMNVDLPPPTETMEKAIPNERLLQ